VPKTNTEIIRDLEKSVATLTGRVDNLRADAERLRKGIEESERKQWNLAMYFVAAFLALLGGVATAMVRK
jgi:hypothetical protein